MSGCVAWVLVSRFPCGSFKVLVWSCSVPRERPFPGPPFPGKTFPRPPFPGPKRAHLSAPALQNTTKIPREDPQKGKKRTNFAAGQGKKKREISGPPTLRAPTLRAPTLRGPTFSGLGPPPFEPPPFSTHPRQLKTQKKPEQLISKNPNN